jgi:hypothetical protein
VRPTSPAKASRGPGVVSGEQYRPPDPGSEASSRKPQTPAAVTTASVREAGDQSEEEAVAEQVGPPRLRRHSEELADDVDDRARQFGQNSSQALLRHSI